MEYKEFVKQRERMCDSVVYCEEGCKLFNLKNELCYDACTYMCLNVNAMEEAEKIVKEWSREHPVKKRVELFIEKYKDKPWQKYYNVAQCNCTKPCIAKIPCSYCEWWFEELEK